MFLCFSFLQEKILDEYNDVLGTAEITLENIQKLTWLEACIKEQWRLYPVAPLIARQIYKPIEISKYRHIFDFRILYATILY